MFHQTHFHRLAKFALLFFCFAIAWHPISAQTQGDENVQELRERAGKLVQAQKMTEALPILERLIILEPDNPENHFWLGFALLAKSATISNIDEQKDLRVRARNSFIKAKQLDVKEPVVDALIHSLPPDGSASGKFSSNAEADALMTEAEKLFSTGQLDDALKKYQKALDLDPMLYEAALFSGDVYYQKEDFKQAEFWYQKAISINPNRETAYRYSAGPLTKEKRFTEARDRYIEAYITEPYSHFSVAGMTQWAQATHTPLSHPKISIPSSVTYDEKGDVKINLDANVLMGGKDDGSFAWIAYGATRSEWHKTKFAKTFPNEYDYRHSLAEEVDALRSVLKIATEDKKIKGLSPSLVRLKELDDKGLLEAYILLAHADDGIAQDHPAYLKKNRAILRKYVVEYVITGGGQ